MWGKGACFFIKMTQDKMKWSLMLCDILNKAKMWYSIDFSISGDWYIKKVKINALWDQPLSWDIN